MTQSTDKSQVKRQITLPLSKAVEIAYKSIRQRLGRSLVVTSGIVLALAFLMSILTNEAMLGGMRQWIEQWPHGAEYAQVTADRAKMQADIEPLSATLHDAAMAPADPAGRTPFDFEKTFGVPAKELQKEVRQFPAPADELAAALTARPELVDTLRKWVDLTRRAEALRAMQNGPQWLEKMMRDNGVSTAPEEIAANRIQTRWLLALALLVAFVGILNAMLMSVTERFREIGTMKCLGALNGFIVKLFLIESLFQGVVGTIIGVVAGVGLSMAALGGSYGTYAWRNIPAGEIALAGLFCLAVGVALTVGGAVYPAWQAARMQPIEAMRVEA